MRTRTAIPAWMLAALPAILFAVSGCQGIAVAGGGYTRVYGDYGYVGPWEGGRVDLQGVYLAPPPYQQFDRGRQEEHRRPAEAPVPERGRGPERGAFVQHQAPAPHPGPVEHRVPEQRPAPVEHRAPEQRAAPVEHPSPRPIPSIPNNPRPARERGNDHTARR